MTGRISREEAAYVADLARLALGEDELDRFTGQLDDILDHVATMEALDLAGVGRMSHPLPLTNVTRADEVREPLDRDEVLAQAPAARDGRFEVPPALGEEP